LWSQEVFSFFLSQTGPGADPGKEKKGKESKRKGMKRKKRKGKETKGKERKRNETNLIMGAIPSFEMQVTLRQSSRQRDVEEHLNLQHFRCDNLTQISHHRNLLLADRQTDNVNSAEERERA
jgi:hypothetical protein